MKILSTLLVFFIISNSNAQDLYGGIEIGSQGVKTSIIKIKNIENETYDLIEFWTTNTGLAKNLAKNGTLDISKIEETEKIVLADFERLQKEFKIGIGDIYIVASSGINKSKNLDVLVNSVIEKTMKNVNVISSKTESVFLLRGCVPQANYLKSLILDFGASGIKGGYVTETKTNSIVFEPINLDFGTISFNEILEQNTSPKKDLETYNEEIFKYVPILDAKMAEMFNKNEISKSKEYIYMQGGAPWAYCMMSLKTVKEEDYNEFTLNDLREYNAFLQNTFEKYKVMAKTNKNIEKVIETYNQRQLIAANTLLISSLENLGNIENKRFFYTKKGQVAWLISYVLDSVKGVKIPY